MPAVASPDSPQQIRSKLATVIYAALGRENILALK